MFQSNLRVLQVTGVLNRGGSEMMVMDMYRNLPQNIVFDFLVNYKVSEIGVFDSEIISRGGKIYRIKSQWSIGPIKYIIQFIRMFAKSPKPDVIHIHMNSRSGIIALASRLIGIKKIIVHSHGDLVFSQSLRSNIIGKLELTFQKVLINSCATDFWGCSDSAIRSLYYNKKIINGRTRVIKNAINVDNFINSLDSDLTELKESLGVPSEALIIGCVGRVVKRKNLSFVIDICADLFRNRTDCYLVIVGKVEDSMYMEEVEQKVVDYDISNRVINLGLREDISDLMAIFDIFVSPALNEAFGIVAIEAQASGLPCILSRDFPKTIDMGLNLVNRLEDFNLEDWVRAVNDKIGCRLNDTPLIQDRFNKLGYNSSTNTLKVLKMYKE